MFWVQIALTFLPMPAICWTRSMTSLSSSFKATFSSRMSSTFRPAAYSHNLMPRWHTTLLTTKPLLIDLMTSGLARKRCIAFLSLIETDPRRASQARRVGRGAAKVPDKSSSSTYHASMQALCKGLVCRPSCITAYRYILPLMGIGRPPQYPV